MTTVGTTLVTSNVLLLNARIWPCSRPASFTRTRAPFIFKNRSNCSAISRTETILGSGEGLGEGDGEGEGVVFGSNRRAISGSDVRLGGGVKLTGTV